MSDVDPTSGFGARGVNASFFGTRFSPLWKEISAIGWMQAYSPRRELQLYRKGFSIEIFVFEIGAKTIANFETPISHTRSRDGWWVQAVRLCIGTRRSRWSLSDVDPTWRLGDRGVNVIFSK